MTAETKFYHTVHFVLGCCPTNASLTTVLIGNRIWSRSCIWGMMVGRTFQHWLNEQVWKCTNLHPKSPEIQYVFGFRNIIVFFCVLVVFLRCVFSHRPVRTVPVLHEKGSLNSMIRTGLCALSYYSQKKVIVKSKRLILYACSIDICLSPSFNLCALKEIFFRKMDLFFLYFEFYIFGTIVWPRCWCVIWNNKDMLRFFIPLNIAIWSLHHYIMM